VAYKDIYYTQGLRTTAHSGVLSDFVPGFDSTVVTRWKDAGAITLGKTNTHEFACGGMEFWGFTVNPHNPDYVTAGSSSGSGAALAAGLCYGASGSDTGGSIRGPAAFCGIAGLKPTYGRVSRYGVFPLSWSLDHCGPMARTVRDCAILLQCMAGFDPMDPTTSQRPVPDYLAALTEDLRGVSVGVPRGWFYSDLHPEMDRAVKDALEVLEALGATLVDVEIEHLVEVEAASGVLIFAEAYSVHEERLATKGHLYGPLAKRRITEGGLYSAAEYLRCMRLRELFMRDVARVFGDVDVLVTPGALEPAYPTEYFGKYPKNTGRVHRPGNMAGIPSLVLPCGYTQSGLPLGMQVMGRWWEDDMVLRVGNAYELATGWHKRRPAIAV
jgi:aspartyl-tRNA(Asn)/glutamyl-tRNA(Gln) amidotransferase subunit A